jgi:hypothetical protein
LDKRFSPEQVEFAFEECLLNLMSELSATNFVDAIWK